MDKNYFNGPTGKERLNWLFANGDYFPDCPRMYVLGDTVEFQGHGVAVVLTADGWHLEDTSGG